MEGKIQSVRPTIRLLVLGFLIALLPSCSYLTQKIRPMESAVFNLPHQITLCDEPIPLASPGVREKLDREFTIAVLDRPQTILWIKRTGRYFPYLEKKLAEEGLPDDLKYLAVAESALLPRIRSNKGAAGLWQLMARTGREYGLRKDKMIDERLDPDRATDAALNYIKDLRDTFGSWSLVLAAYNCGENRLKREIRKQKVNDFYSLNLPSETERFIYRITAIKIILENPQQQGYYLTKDQMYQPLEYETVQVRIHKQLHLTDMASALGTDYRVLKELNPHILKHWLPTGQYAIKVPPGTGIRVAAFLQELDQSSSSGSVQAADGHYIVRPGDTLSHIALRTGVSVTILKKLNDIKGSLVRVGQRLQLAP